MNRNAAAAFIFIGNATAWATVYWARGDEGQTFWAVASACFAFFYAIEVLRK